METSNKKKIVYLVPHSHWDREWYFSFDTSNVLLHHNIIDALKEFKDQKWFLDGQWSLVDDFIKWNPSKREQIINLLKEQKISSGPLYSQPDVFNSLAETIFRNFEVGEQIANDLGVKQLKTAYLPDTFGFGQNLPQIFRKAKVDNFVFWRGLPKEELEKSNTFVWEGLDGTKINSFVMSEGYYSMGMYYPYNGDKYYPEKNDPKHFLEKVTKRINNISNPQEKIIVPLGGDQAPFMHACKEFIAKVNQISTEFEFVIASNFDHYFDNNITTVPTYSGELRSPVSGKIHRTISSSRYDIKKKFRDIENKLYFQLEPLEILYSQKDANYEFESFKVENIIKPLLIAQTHDSLGACNTDLTNAAQWSRLERIEQNVDSQIELLIKKLIQDEMYEEESHIVFNPAPFKNNLFERKVMFTSELKSVNISSDSYFIKTLSTKNIGIGDKKIYKHDVITGFLNLEPLNIRKFALNDLEIPTVPAQREIKFDNELIILPLSKKDICLKFSIVNDNGDSYDSDPLNAIELSIKHKVLKAIKMLDEVDFIEFETLVNNQSFIWNVFLSNDEAKIKLITKNTFEGKRVSIEITSDSVGQILKSQNLAITPFIEKEIANNWKELGFSEKPLNVDINDGIIEADDFAIITKGNNETYKVKDGISLTLYRTYEFVTRGDLITRPSTSGLSWFQDSHDSLLKKELVFDLVITCNEATKAFNEHAFEPRSYMHQNKNFIANKMTKFVINDILNKKPVNSVNPLAQNGKVLFSSFRMVGQNIVARVANPYRFEMEWNGIKFSKYEIAEISFKDKKWIKN